GGDGVLALFEGSEQGLTLSSTETNPDLPSPTALAFSAVLGGQVQFYAATEGREAAALVALSLGGEVASLAAPAGSATLVVAQLVPLQESSLALVGTLLIVSVPSSTSEASLGAEETEAAALTAQPVSFATAVSLGQGLSAQSQDNESGSVGGEPPATAEDA